MLISDCGSVPVQVFENIGETLHLVGLLDGCGSAAFDVAWGGLDHVDEFEFYFLFVFLSSFFFITAATTTTAILVLKTIGFDFSDGEWGVRTHILVPKVFAILFSIC